MRVLLFAIVVCSLPTLRVVAAAPQFSRNRELPPLTLSISDLDTILAKAHSLLERANGRVQEHE